MSLVPTMVIGFHLPLVSPFKVVWGFLSSPRAKSICIGASTLSKRLNEKVGEVPVIAPNPGLSVFYTLFMISS